MEREAEQLERRWQEMDQRGDSVALGLLLLEILEKRPSPALSALAAAAALRVTDEALERAQELLQAPDSLASLIALLDRQEVARRPDDTRDGLRRQLQLLRDLATLVHAAHPEFANDTVQLLDGGTLPEGRADLVVLLRDLHSRGYPVFEQLLRLLKVLPPTEAHAQALQNLLERLRRTAAPLRLSSPGQCGVLLYYSHPAHRVEIGRATRVSVTVDRNGMPGIAMAAQLEAQARDDFPLTVREGLNATAQQAYEAASELLGTGLFRVTWELDLAGTPIQGGSFGLSLALAILSAHSNRPLLEGLAAAGVLCTGGGVTQVAGLPAKCTAACSQGVRTLLLPRANAENLDPPLAVRRLLDRSGITVFEVGSLTEACEILAARNCILLPPPPDPVPTAAEALAWGRGSRMRKAAIVSAAVFATAGVVAFWPRIGSSARRDGERSAFGAASPNAQATRPLVRFRYYVADGDFLADALARGEYRRTFKFDRDPLVVDNSVKRLTLELYRKYFRKTSAGMKLAEGFLPLRVRSLVPGLGDRLKGEVRRTGYHIPGPQDPLFYALPSENNPHASFVTVHRKAIPALVSERPFMKQDPLSRDLMRENPNIWDLVELTADVNRPGECGEERDQLEEMDLRPLKLTFLDVENAGQAAVTDIRYVMKTLRPPDHGALRLRTVQDTNRALVACAEETVALPYDTLKPGEHILIPCAIGLGGVRDDWEDTRAMPIVDNREPGFYFDVSEPLANRAGPYHQAYSFGPAIQVVRVDYRQASGERYQEGVRSISDRRLQLTQNVELGSCPLVVAYHEPTSQWVSLGHVLKRFRGSNIDGHESLAIAPTFSRVQLREVESETTYIDRVSLEIRTKGGKSKYVNPNDPRLRRQDGNFVVLHRGDALDLEFETSHFGAESILHVWGHYIPDPVGSHGSVGSRH